MSRIALFPVSLLVLACILPMACSDGGPGACTGTCIVVDNQSDLKVQHVYFRTCGDILWGENRLDVVLWPGQQQEWSMSPGCWDIMVQAPDSEAKMVTRFQSDVEIGPGQRHVFLFSSPSDDATEVPNGAASSVNAAPPGPAPGGALSTTSVFRVHATCPPSRPPASGAR